MKLTTPCSLFSREYPGHNLGRGHWDGAQRPRQFEFIGTPKICKGSLTSIRQSTDLELGRQKEKKKHYLKHEREQCARYSGLGIALVLTGQNENLIISNH